LALTYLGHFESGPRAETRGDESFEEAQLLVADSGDFFTEASLLNGPLVVHFDTWRSESSSAILNRALEKNRALDERIGIAHALWSLGKCHFVDGDMRSSLDSLSKARNTFHSLSNRRMEGYVLQDMGVVLEAVGEGAQAVAHLNESKRIALSIEDGRMEAWALTGIRSYS
jgi:hypothetical protein